MRILALDTSAVCACVAVSQDGKILCETNINTGLTHSRTLLPMIKSSLENSGIELSSIDLFACSEGPGSFTGIRIGVSAIKGLCFGTDKKCVPVSTLEALAYNLLGRNAVVCSVMDARCSQVYCGIFRVSGNEVQRLRNDEAIKISELSEILKNFSEEIIFVGDGAKLCYEALGYSIAPSALVFQKGSSVALLAERNIQRAISGNDLRPVYLRLPQAERELNNKKKNNK